MNDFIGAFKFIGHNFFDGHGQDSLLTLTGKHLVLTGASVGIALVIALPLGLWLGHLHKGSFLAINGSNVARALPSLALIAIGIKFLGIGFVNSMVALIVVAFPPILINTYVGVAQVERDAVEAAQGMGMRPLQVLRQVEIPLALPLIFAGLRTSVVFVIATAIIASVAGGSSLGDIIFNQASYGLPGVIGAAIVVAVLALIFEVGGGLLQRAVTPQGLKRSGRIGTEKRDALVPSVEPT